MRKPRGNRIHSTSGRAGSGVAGNSVTGLIGCPTGLFPVSCMSGGKGTGGVSFDVAGGCGPGGELVAGALVLGGALVTGGAGVALPGRIVVDVSGAMLIFCCFAIFLPFIMPYQSTPPPPRASPCRRRCG